MNRKIRTAILSVTDKSGIIPLAKALHESGTILYVSSGTQKVLNEAGIPNRSVETITRTPEAFQGRMKTLSFPLLGGILSRRNDPSDLADLKKLEIEEIDAVVVNFYAFEKAPATATSDELTELIDIGGPTLVRAAAKNAESVLVLTDPSSYGPVINQLRIDGMVSKELRIHQAKIAWKKVLDYDRAIFDRLVSSNQGGSIIPLRYGENPHQSGKIEVDEDSPIDWAHPISKDGSLSFNNVMDMSSGFQLVRELKLWRPDHHHVVIVKHNNPCGVASVPKNEGFTAPLNAQMQALSLAWAGDPVSAFGGVVIFSEPLEAKTLSFFDQKFVDCILVPAPEHPTGLQEIEQFAGKRKNLKVAWIRHWGMGSIKKITVPGAQLVQSVDTGMDEEIEAKTSHRQLEWKSKESLVQFGIQVCRSLKSNSIAVVRQVEGNQFQLIGAGQGQPNRIDAIRILAAPRARSVLAADPSVQNVEQGLRESVLISDAFFPFSDSIEVATEAGFSWIVEPGGSIRDREVIAEAEKRGIALAFTGRRHFNH